MAKCQMKATTGWQDLNKQNPEAIEKVHQLVMEDHKMTIREIEIKILFCSVQTVVLCFDVTCCCKIRPRILTPELN